MKENLLSQGRSLWDFTVDGEVILFDDDNFPPMKDCIGKIIITHSPTPDIVMYMRHAIAIVAETGGILCHAAVLALEMGLPIIVACPNVLELLKDGQNVKLISEKGIGSVYA